MAAFMQHGRKHLLGMAASIIAFAQHGSICTVWEYSHKRSSKVHYLICASNPYVCIDVYKKYAAPARRISLTKQYSGVVARYQTFDSIRYGAGYETSYQGVICCLYGLSARMDMDMKPKSQNFWPEQRAQQDPGLIAASKHTTGVMLQDDGVLVQDNRGGAMNWFEGNFLGGCELIVGYTSW
ncbi:hypothetical protein BDZ91DRAFT_768118 [Kalaharituber pfeilii]|nr:hypothetical protein BDZ91DRAFT_768118 [Kalaharituber pfeilii]